uniref:Uncharacterized protein n=1 Tax=Rhizophora mucronata TaxID=61149 RepID=A0A2P2QIC1_RHIMU
MLYYKWSILLLIKLL